MNRQIAHVTFALTICLAAAVPSPAQRAVAKSGLNVRSGQSTSSAVVDHLAAGDTVSLVSAKPRSGYLHITTSSGTTGWAWAVRLDILGGAAPGTAVTGRSGGTPTSAPTGTSSSTGTHATASAIDASWPKVATNAAPYTWPDTPHTSCAAGGVGGDTITNRWKNRTDSSLSRAIAGWRK